MQRRKQSGRPSLRARALFGPLAFLALMTGACEVPGGVGQQPELPQSPSFLYISLWAEGVGQIRFDEESHHYHALGDPQKSAMALDFIAEQQVNELGFYNLGALLSDPERAASLGAFIKAARDIGVGQAVAIGSTKSDFDRIATFQTQALATDPLTSFDGLLTETEFWNEGGDFDEYLELLDHMGSLDLKNRDGDPLVLSTYQGWLDKNPGIAERCSDPNLGDAGCIAELVSQRVDRVLLHVYTDTPVGATTYGADRFDHYRAASRPVQLLPIFAYEDPEFSAGDEYFQGEWLCEHRAGGLLGAEDAFNEAAAVPAVGFAHYSYYFADMYLNYAECP